MGNLIVALLSTFNVAFRTICIVNTVRRARTRRLRHSPFLICVRSPASCVQFICLSGSIFLTFLKNMPAPRKECVGAHVRTIR